MNSQKRVVVLGLDGVSATLAGQLAANGIMPCLGRILSESQSKGIDTVHPPLSSVSWTTFFTGANPGHHRIYGFYECQVDSYDIWLQGLDSVRAPAIWQRLQAQGKRSIIANLPGTYPAEPLNGVMISGFMALDWEKSIYPKALSAPLRQSGYTLDVECKNALTEPEKFLDACEASIRARGHVFSTLLAHEPHDLFIGVFTETDRLQHYYFDAIEEPEHPLRPRVMEIFSLLDTQLEACLRHVRDEDALVLIADHGFCRIRQEIHINHWLRKHGYLVLKNESPEAGTRDIDAERSAAFSLDPGRIYLNIRGRQPQGILHPADARKVAQEIAQGLQELDVTAIWSRNPVKPIRRVFQRDEIYEGPYAFLGPDLVVDTHDGFDPKGRLCTPGITTLKGLSGMHTYGDALFSFRNTHQTWSDCEKIEDVAGKILGEFEAELP